MVVETHSTNSRDVENGLVHFFCLLILLLGVGERFRWYYAGEFLVHLPQAVEGVPLVCTRPAILGPDRRSRSSRQFGAHSGSGLAALKIGHVTHVRVLESR